MPNDDLVEAVLKHSDIVSVVSSYLPVIKKGKSHVCLCPFHDDKHPSMQVSQEKQIFKCFVCGEGGNAISFVQKMEKIPFRQAMIKVAQISGYEDPRLKENVVVMPEDEAKSRLYKVIEDVQTYYRYSLTIPEGEKARNYLESRGLTPEIQTRFGIGYAPSDGAKTVAYLQAKKHSLKAIEEAGIALNNSKDRYSGRITFALSSPDGKINGFSARRFEEGQEGGKYVNSPEGPIFHKGENLYNYANVVSASRLCGYVYLCEGFMDVIALYKAGVQSAIASMGTALTEGQIRLIKRLKCEVRLCLDGDAPGQEASIKTGALLNKNGIPYSIVDYEGDTRDPDEIFAQEGAAGLLKRLEKRATPFEFALKFYSAKSATLDVNERKRLAERFLPYLRQTPPGLQYEDLLNRIADATGFHKEAIREMAQSEVVPEEGEQITYVKGSIRGKGARGNRNLSALVLAEKTFLHYMLTCPQAVEYYKGHAIRFKGEPLHEALAQYILEFEKTHPGMVDVSLLQGYIADSEGEGGDPLLSKISEFTLEEGKYPPPNEEEFSRLESKMKEETDKLVRDNAAKKALRDGSKDEQAKALKAYAEALRQKREKNKKGA